MFTFVSTSTPPYPPDIMFNAHPLLPESYYVSRAILEFSLLAKAEITEGTFGYLQFWCIILFWAHSPPLPPPHCVLCDLGTPAFRQSQSPRQEHWLSSGAHSGSYRHLAR